MSADGNWKITINTPMGARTMDVAIATSGDSFTGKVDSEMGAQEVTGKVNGDTLTWTSDITNPMPLTLAFSGKVDGDSIAGEMGIGPMGSFPFKGVRA